MNRIKFQIESRDGISLNASCWQTTGTPIAAIALIHGLGEHHMRYEHVARFYTDKGITVYSMDLRGHGESEGKRAFSPSREAFEDDIELLLLKIREEYLDLPIILYGHSMGGNLSLDYLVRNQGKEIRGAIITSPWIQLTKKPSGAEILLANVMNRIAPAYSQYHGLKAEDLSRDPEIGRAYMKDPLVHIRITARLFKICHENASYILENADRINTKMLLIHGTADGITSHKGSEELAQKTGADLKLWEDFRHETHNEFGLEEVLDFQYKWIMKNLDII